MNYISDITMEMYRWFDELNVKFFHKSLKQPIITIQKSKGNTLGHFTCSKVWTAKNDGENQYEINISAHTLHREIEDIVGTLLHEMIHYYNKENGISDAPNNKHNKKFKAFAEKVGFDVSCSKSYGWGHTKVNEDLKSYILATIKPDESLFIYSRTIPVEIEKEKKKRSKNIFKYRCPECDMEVKGKADISILCGNLSKRDYSSQKTAPPKRGSKDLILDWTIRRLLKNGAATPFVLVWIRTFFCVLARV
jgi:predicted SprT family Zn-dependent metalloprotease